VVLVRLQAGKTMKCAVGKDGSRQSSGRWITVQRTGIGTQAKPARRMDS
jgi:hypothetical protein